MVESSVLNQNVSIHRVIFDPKNKKHTASLQNYLQTGKWGNVQFFAEAPYTTVEMTVLRKFASSKLL